MSFIHIVPGAKYLIHVSQYLYSIYTRTSTASYRNRIAPRHPPAVSFRVSIAKRPLTPLIESCPSIITALIGLHHLPPSRERPARIADRRQPAGQKFATRRARRTRSRECRALTRNNAACTTTEGRPCRCRRRSFHATCPAARPGAAR